MLELLLVLLWWLPLASSTVSPNCTILTFIANIIIHSLITVHFYNVVCYYIILRILGPGTTKRGKLVILTKPGNKH